VTAGARPLVLCLVGTDHHPFQRLVSWCDTLATSRTDVDVLVQHGQSPPPGVAEGRAFLGRDELDSLLLRASVAVSHGGPGLISEIRAAGLRPLAVPRDPDRGEHVDGHQMRFLERMGERGLVEVVTSERPFLDSIARRLAHPHDERVDRLADQARVLASVHRFAGLVEDLYARRPRQAATGGPGRRARRGRHHA
jgi:UDP-N-acetylglucosamine transferase subunit ALG13